MREPNESGRIEGEVQAPRPRSRGISRGRGAAARREGKAPADQETPRARKKKPAGRRRLSLPVILLALAVGFGAGLGTGWFRWEYERPYTVDLKAVEVPSWVEQDFIRKNIFSRPDVSLKRVNAIVIHYVANIRKILELSQKRRINLG